MVVDPCGIWELNLGPLEELPVFLTTKSSLQPLFLYSLGSSVPWNSLWERLDRWFLHLDGLLFAILFLWFCCLRTLNTFFFSYSKCFIVFLPVYFLINFFKRQSYSIPQATLELTILLPQLLKCWDHSPASFLSQSPWMVMSGLAGRKCFLWLNSPMNGWNNGTKHFLSSDLNSFTELSQGSGDSRSHSFEGPQQAYAVCFVSNVRGRLLWQGNKSRSEMESSAEFGDAYL